MKKRCEACGDMFSFSENSSCFSTCPKCRRPLRRLPKLAHTESWRHPDGAKGVDDPSEEIPLIMLPWRNIDDDGFLGTGRRY